MHDGGDHGPEAPPQVKTFPELMPRESTFNAKAFPAARVRDPSVLELAARDRNWRLGRVRALESTGSRLLHDIFGARSTSMYKVLAGFCNVMRRRIESDFERTKGMELSLRASVIPAQGNSSSTLSTQQEHA